MTMTTMTMTTRKNHRGIPIGAVRLNPQDLQAFRVLLEQEFGPIRFRGVERLENNQLLVHVPPRVAAALDDDDEQFNAFFQSTTGAIYLPGLRRTLALPAPSQSISSSSSSISNDSSFTFVELFAGIGGFRLGLEAIGGTSVLASELSPYAARIYQSHFSNDLDCLVQGDILDLDLTHFPDYAMLTAGFPCQPFSNRGLQQGLDDEKSGQLYLELTRILSETQPPCFLFENVASLVLLDGGSRSDRIKGEKGTFVMGKVMERILKSFASCGYQVDWNIVNSRHYLPQNRERVYFVGTRNDLQCDRFDWDRILPNKSSTTTVRDILEPKDSPSVLKSELNPSQWRKVQSTYTKKNTVPAIDGSVNLDGKAPTLISQYHRVGSLSTKFIFEQSDGTVCDGNDDGNRRPRFLTPRECCRIMGFPDFFSISGEVAHFYQGIGNAVTPPVIAAIGGELMRCVRHQLSSNDERTTTTTHILE